MGKFKKIAVLLLTLSMGALALTGCLEDEDFYEYDEDFYEYDEGFADEGEGDSDYSRDEASSGVSTLRESRTVDSNGELSIDRGSLGSTPMGEDGTWTIFVYLCGSDLESDGGMATMDLNEMCYASTGSSVRFIIQTGGAVAWENSEIGSDESVRLEICDGEMTRLGTVPVSSMGESSVLADFISWGTSNYAASKMGLILWNHGGGSITGICFDENYYYDSLSLTELESALLTGTASMTDRFEFIGFDACLMGTVETANVLAPYARYMYGSQETEPGYGWDYEAIGNFLGNDPYADGLALGQEVVDSFYTSCEYIFQESGATLSVLDLDAIDNLLVEFNEFAQALYNSSEDSSSMSAFVRSVSEADNYGGNNKSEGYTNMVDMKGLVAAGSESGVSGDDVISAIENMVVYMKNGSDHAEAGGISIYYPLQVEGSSELMTFGDIAISPYYLSFVNRMAYGHSNEGDISGYDETATIDYWNSGALYEDEYYYDEYSWEEFYQEYESTLDSYSYEITGESSLIDFYMEPQIYNDGTYGFVLSDQAIQNTASVNAAVYMISDDFVDIIEMGYSADIIADWYTGEFTDNFDGYWFSLPDGQILAVYIVDECDGYDIYTSPVILNGEETNIRITHDYMNGIVTIDGVWSGIDENGMSGAVTQPLEAGDSVIPIYYCYGIETGEEGYYYGEEYYFDGDSQITFSLLYDGEYLYGFHVNDIYGDYYETDYVNFTVDGEDIYYYEY